MEISDVRRRLRHAIDHARRVSAERRDRADVAGRAYERFLSEVATPLFRMVAIALTAEGYPFKVHTPGGGLRLASERSPGDFIELSLDASSDPPTVTALVNRGRGSRLITAERPVRPGVPVEQLTDEEVLEFLLAEIEPFVAR